MPDYRKPIPKSQKEISNNQVEKIEWQIKKI